ncbi:MAG: hypothetical protein HY674_06360 [Chloroflexi bacterium]|nr:hypothetical protein [Chloroflexota bacterium]
MLARRQTIINGIGLVTQQIAGLQSDISNHENGILAGMGNSWQPFGVVVGHVSLLVDMRATLDLLHRYVATKQPELGKIDAEIGDFQRKHGVGSAK